MWGKDLLEKGSYWRTGSGTSIQVYKNRWIPRPFLFKPFSLSSLPSSTTVADLKSTEGAWNSDLIKRNFMEEDFRAITSIPLSQSPKEDILAWYYDPKGAYMVKSGYQVAVEHKEEQSATVSNLVPE